ncbi:hypothetical protein PVAR5_6178 [Paecilomyces variotii No. 5]|uniref:Uncharacterized protein n=1 Tax=Byssochlamys spectabilis (strain No. 5 / NBRC 109023) TaxID=1356009 RepID=V5G9E0_BYSSN|nr:hypothetical protein PVAR5_6178 [Paecilomyces variotii No. 5]
MKQAIVFTFLLAALATAAPMASAAERRDGTTEFDMDFGFKKRDGTTEFDPDYVFKKRDGATEFDPDFGFKRT